MSATSVCPSIAKTRMAFIGGGNMASAIVSGLLRQGTLPGQIQVVDPQAEVRHRLQQSLGVHVCAHAKELQSPLDMVVWAVKPQVFKQVSMDAKPYCGHALHLSVAAGIGSESIARWLQSQHIVRAMPNTPALVGKGATGLFARAAVCEAQKQLVEHVLAPTGLLRWMPREELLEAVTAVSGSGPAYVFYFLEAMVQAGQDMGLSAAEARTLAIATFDGAATLAANSTEDLAELRSRVTSKGGTTHAAIESMESDHVRQAIAQAMHACRRRAQELAAEFGA